VIRAWPVADVVAAEQVLLSQGRDLMAIASWGLARRCAAELRRSRGRISGAEVLLLVGAGNNGGDALHAGALLRARGVAVTALLVADRAHQPGLAALRAADGRVVQLRDDPESATHGLTLLARADLAIDGILGIGGRGALRGPAALLASDGSRPRLVVACDLPSGLDADTGMIAGPVLSADVTVTFGVAKPGLLLPPGDAVCGDIEVVDLGLDLCDADTAVARWQLDDAAATWPWPRRTADKYSRGVLGVMAGSPAYPGAGVLAASAAVAAGAGMVRYAGDLAVAREVVRAAPEVVPDPLPGTGRVQAWLVGPGLDPADPAAADLVNGVLDRLRAAPDLPAVVDAGALVAVASAAAAATLPNPARLLLVPHAGELAAMLIALGTRVDRTAVTAEPARWVRAAATLTGATVLLKGATTLVGGAAGRVITTASGPAWLATAGSGDTLAGIAGALLAAGVAPGPAAATAALVHGHAGRLASGRSPADGPVRAGALVATIARAIAELRAII